MAAEVSCHSDKFEVSSGQWLPATMMLAALPYYGRRRSRMSNATPDTTGMYVRDPLGRPRVSEIVMSFGLFGSS
jgi:hypothetical protein